MANVKDNKVIREYFESEVQNLKNIFPKASEEEIRDFLKKKIDETVEDIDVELYNNYTNTVKQTTLSKIVNFIEKKDPILTEHGVMYKKHSEAKNLNAGLLDFLIAQRKVEKNLMFECIEAADKETDPEKKAALLKQAAVHDTKQKIYKIVANS